MSIAGGPINHREIAAANESGEGEYRDKCRTEEHLGAGEKDHQLCVFYTASNCSLVQPAGTTQNISLVGLFTGRVLRRPYTDAKSPRLLHWKITAQLLVHFT
jgi:hypothetical protein